MINSVKKDSQRKFVLTNVFIDFILKFKIGMIRRMFGLETELFYI